MQRLSCNPLLKLVLGHLLDGRCVTVKYGILLEPAFGEHVLLDERVVNFLGAIEIIVRRALLYDLLFQLGE